MTVAAARRLGDGIQPRLGTPDLGQRDVHACLDQAGGDQPHRPTVTQPLPRLGEHLPTVLRAHQRAEMHRPGQFADRFVQRRGMRAAVDDAQHLRLVREARGDCGVGYGLRHHLNPHALQRGVEGTGLRGQLARVVEVESALEAVLLSQRRLGRGAEHDAAAVVARQLLQRRHAGAQHWQRQGLCLVQHDHRLGQVVQLAAAGGAAGEKTLEELHRGGDDDRRVPVLRRALQPGEAVRLRPLLRFRAFPVHAGMVLQHVVLRAQGAAEHVDGLFDDRGEGHHIDHAPQPMPARMLQREGERGQRLAAAGGHGEGEEARCQRGLRPRMLQHPLPQRVDIGRSRRRQGCQGRFESLAEHVQRAMAAAVRGPAPGPGKEGLRRQEIGIHQAREQHPRQECLGEAGMRGGLEAGWRHHRLGGRQGAGMRLPPIIWFQPVIHTEARGPQFLAIGQPSMVRRDDASQQPSHPFWIAVQGLPCSGRGMVRSLTTWDRRGRDVGLISAGDFSDVMKEAGDSRHF